MQSAPGLSRRSALLSSLHAAPGAHSCTAWRFCSAAAVCKVPPSDACWGWIALQRSSAPAGGL